MREVGIIFAYVAAILICGAFAAPPLYWLGRWCVDTDVIPQLAPFGFGKYFNRAMLLATLAFLWPFLRALRLESWRALGIAPNPMWRQDLLRGLALGAGGLSMVAAIATGLGYFEVFDHIRWDKVAAALGTAVTVAVLEEIFFRGVLFGVLRRRLPIWPALIFLSVFFAALHFIKPDPQHTIEAAQDMWAGFRLLPHSFWQFAEPARLLGGWVSLVWVGLVLGLVTWRTRSLFWAIGLHAGWVFALRLFKFHSTRLTPANVLLGDDLISGALPIGLLVVTFLVCYRGTRTRVSATTAPN